MPLDILSHLSYLALFVIMVIEGPIVTSAAAFAATFGFFSLPMVFMLSVLGDLAGDIIYYAIGRGSRKTLIDRHGHKFGLNQDSLARFDRAFRKHEIKSLVIAKLAPAIPGPVLIAAGALRVSFWTLIWVSLVLAVPKYALFMILGYWFGDFYVKFFHYYDILGWILVPAFIIGCYVIYKKALAAVLEEADEP
ncbi:MAG TPA: VTT domain-containing protein [Candidatus Paceibacterota bacterium]|nr:VTT domain-containing protein [Candidatus Paceibacterota bacterium]